MDRPASPIERMVAGQHLVQYHRAAELVTAGVYHAACLLWCHIAYRTAHGNRFADPDPRFQGPRNAKIGDYQAVVLLMDQNIFRFDITMNDRARACMGIVERAHQLME